MKKIFAANWKLNKTPAETRQFLTELKAQSAKAAGEVVIFPSAASWEAASTTLRESGVKWGGQNIWTEASGAFTGENSAAVLKELGASYALIGHSERRNVFGEKDSLITEKVAFVQSLGLIPLLCIGETLEERQAERTNEINEKHITEGLAKADRTKPLVIAYEPVWAIGTGVVATPEQVGAAHLRIREILNGLRIPQAPILYGGSVKPDNAAALLKIPHVDGFLIGGASLEVDSLLKIAAAK